MKISNESASEARKLLAELKDLGLSDLWNTGIVENVIGQYIEKSWQQGFSDCEMAQRIARMRNAQV